MSWFDGLDKPGVQERLSAVGKCAYCGGPTDRPAWTEKSVCERCFAIPQAAKEMYRGAPAVPIGHFMGGARGDRLVAGEDFYSDCSECSGQC